MAKKAPQITTVSEEDEQLEEPNPKTSVDDDSELDLTVTPIKYQITSFGADYDAEGLVKRLIRGDIFIPPFQRDYVWNISEASRFIESLLLGLPVPGIFLARDANSKRLLVIDGQQRLKTLQFFFAEKFNPLPKSTVTRVFRLTHVQPQYEGATYSSLQEHDRITLNDSIIHATIVKQDSPEEDQSSVYHIFERLNTSGRKLSPQQIRVAIYHSEFLEAIRKLDEHASWRENFGRKSRTLKDQELILRFLALYYDLESYSRPMSEFLNHFCEKVIQKKLGAPSIAKCVSMFRKTIDLIQTEIGVGAFRPERAINAAVFDSLMVGVATFIDSKKKASGSLIKRRYETLRKNKEYLELVSRATADDSNVKRRIELAIEHMTNG